MEGRARGFLTLGGVVGPEVSSGQPPQAVAHLLSKPTSVVLPLPPDA